MANSLVDYIFAQESYDNTAVEVELDKRYKGENGEDIPVVLKLRRPSSIDLIAMLPFVESEQGSAVVADLARYAAGLVEEPALDDPRMLAKFSAKNAAEVFSRWLDVQDITKVVTAVTALLGETAKGVDAEREQAKNS